MGHATWSSQLYASDADFIERVREVCMQEC
jgi:hypothetical protein